VGGGRKKKGGAVIFSLFLLKEKKKRRGKDDYSCLLILPSLPEVRGEGKKDRSSYGDEERRRERGILFAYYFAGEEKRG